MSETALHTKYRPSTLEEIVGHEKIVSTLQGIVAKDKWPSAIALFGPTSSGKTTLAYALVSSCLGVPANSTADFTEINAADSKTIDDVRGLIQVSKLRPSHGKRRFILIDEAQGLLSNPQAAAALLKPLESPPKSTTWIIGSMDPQKFDATANGKAIANRCTQFNLSVPSDDDLHKQARRILKGEEITYIGKEARQVLVENCNHEMRTLANLIQGAVSYYDGLKEKPDQLTPEDIGEVLKSTTGDDGVLAVRFLTALYLYRFGAAQKELLNMNDGFGFINKLMYMNWYMLNTIILKGERHPKVWGDKFAQVLVKQVGEIHDKAEMPPAGRIELVGLVQSRIARLRSQAQAFSIPEQMALSQFAFDTIQELKQLVTK